MKPRIYAFYCLGFLCPLIFFLIKKYFDLIVALDSNLVWFTSDTVLLPIQGKRGAPSGPSSLK